MIFWGYVVIAFVIGMVVGAVVGGMCAAGSDDFRVGGTDGD